MATIAIVGSFADSLIAFRGHLFQAMVARGHHVVAFAPGASPEIQQNLDHLGVQYQNFPIERTGLNPAKDSQTLLGLFSLFHTIKPEFFLGYTIKPVVYGTFAAKMADVPEIYSMITGLGAVFTENRRKNQALKSFVQFLYKVSLKTNQKVFFQNPDDRNFFKQAGLVREEQAVLINGSGVDVSSYTPTPFLKQFSFLLIARLLEDKGVREYVKAARILKQKYPEIIFRLVGWRDSNPTVISEEELNSWVQAGVIEYLGKLSDVRPTIAASTIYVLPSYREGTPRTVLEAMAMGRPIITTNAPGCRETVSDGKNGFLVTVKDVQGLAEAMERFIQHPELIEPMGQESRRIAIEKYDVHRVNAVILNTMGL